MVRRCRETASDYIGLPNSSPRQSTENKGFRFLALENIGEITPSRTKYWLSLVHFEKRFAVAVVSEMQINAPGGRPDCLNSRCLRSAIRAERRQHFSFTLEDFLLFDLLPPCRTSFVPRRSRRKPKTCDKTPEKRTCEQKLIVHCQRQTAANHQQKHYADTYVSQTLRFWALRQFHMVPTEVTVIRRHGKPLFFRIVSFVSEPMSGCVSLSTT